MDKNIFDNIFFEKLEENIKNFHKLFTFNHLKAELLEELISKSMNHIDHLWCCYSHRSDCDIILKDEKNTRISIKSGKISKKGKDKNKLIISSHRTTKYKTIEEKEKFIEENISDYILSLVFDNYEKTYEMFLIPGYIFKEKRIWKKYKNKFESINNKIDMKIVFSMSHQLWYKIDIGKLNIKSIWKIKI